jgi:N-carbamoylputrescine amidase
VVTVNRVGVEGSLKFWGGSFVADPFGKILCSGSHDKEEVIVQEVNLSETEYYRNYWTFLRDRRIDTYQPVIKRYTDEESNEMLRSTWKQDNFPNYNNLVS